MAASAAHAACDACNFVVIAPASSRLLCLVLQTSAVVVFKSKDAVRAMLAASSEGEVLTVDSCRFGQLREEQPYGLKGIVEAHKAQTPGNGVTLQRVCGAVAALL